VKVSRGEKKAAKKNKNSLSEDDNADFQEFGNLRRRKLKLSSLSVAANVGNEGDKKLDERFKDYDDQQPTWAQKDNGTRDTFLSSPSNNEKHVRNSENFSRKIEPVNAEKNVNQKQKVSTAISCRESADTESTAVLEHKNGPALISQIYDRYYGKVDEQGNREKLTSMYANLNAKLIPDETGWNDMRSEFDASTETSESPFLVGDDMKEEEIVAKVVGIMTCNGMFKDNNNLSNFSEESEETNVPSASCQFRTDILSCNESVYTSYDEEDAETNLSYDSEGYTINNDSYQDDAMVNTAEQQRDNVMSEAIHEIRRKIHRYRISQDNPNDVQDDQQNPPVESSVQGLFRSLFYCAPTTSPRRMEHNVDVIPENEPHFEYLGTEKHGEGVNRGKVMMDMRTSESQKRKQQRNRRWKNSVE